jgi:tRNA 2-thiouridine synthesizing protein E
MSLDVNGKSIETTDEGYLADINDWSEDVAKVMAKKDSLELTQKHWDLLNYLRDEHINNGGNEPNERTILKAMGDIWGNKPSSKDTYDLFPLAPSKQGRKIAGLPKSNRKGGY